MSPNPNALKARAVQAEHCDPDALVLVTRQFVALLTAGVPLLRALEVLQKTDDRVLARALVDITDQVSAGHRLSQALSRHPSIFPNIYVFMVRIGETTGALVSSLKEISTWLERDKSLRSKASKALTYPALVLSLTIFLSLVVVWTVLPPFMEMYSQAKIPLPWPTLLLMLVTNAVRSPLFWVVLVLLGLSLGELLRRRWATEEGACAIYSALQAIPVVGGLLTCAGLSRWAISLQALLTSGVDLHASLALAGHSSGNPRLAMDSRKASQAIREGEDLSGYLRSQPDLYPGTLVQFVKAGEESSALPAMLRRCGDIFTQDLEARVEMLGASLEPFLLTLVASIVGFVLISIFLPLYSFADKLG
ncbi:MAG: type II secretion system F family protein [Vulcanimicrobiota bacterium]